MRYVLALFITLLVSSTAFSQTGTVTLSYPVAKKVALDLVSYDSTKEALGLTTKVLEMTEDKCRMKDSIIKSNEFKASLFRQQITMYEAKEESYQKMVSTLKLDLAKQRAKTKLLIGIGGAAIITTSAILLLSGK
jgi:CRISPR/Cas system CMR subunit Cmr6 (Cas7 group RAMP superfamily)